MKQKKIALIGNMNNNNFSIMRYFRDLGLDAHLLLFENDGVGSNSHFIPEKDTWEHEKWKPYIHQFNFSINPAIAQKRPFKLRALYTILRLWHFVRNAGNSDLYKPVSTKKIKSVLEGFDIFIGSGLTGVMLERIGLKLDIYYPYSMGIEYVGEESVLLGLKHRNPIKRYLTKSIANAQTNAIKKARVCLTGEMSLTKKTFDKLNVDFVPLSVPMVYNGEVPPKLSLKNKVSDIKSYEFTIFTHARQLWVRKDSYTETEWDSFSKHNEWLFNSVAQLKKIRPKLDFKVFALEYGEDVSASKKLCAKLGIEENVEWIPKMSRKELMLLLRHCHIGVGEFYTDPEVMWGGTGWEVLAMGKPLLQGFNFEIKKYEQYFGHKPPSMLPVKQESDILKHLVDISDNPKKGIDIGNKALEWFNANGGLGLAKKWLELIKKEEL